MPFILQLPDQYGLVLAAATSTFFVNTVHTIIVSKNRKSSGIKYPNAYATPEHADKDKAAFKFNCAQRAHYNFIENHTSTLGALLISGLHFPVAAAALGAGWSLSRIMYAVGYVSKGPGGREAGAIGNFITDFALKVMAAYTSYLFVTSQ